MAFAQPIDFLLISQAAAAAFAAARLLHFGLRPRFPLLLSYLLFVAISSAIFSLLPASSSIYYWAYMTCQPAAWVIGALAVREMFTLIFLDYPGLRTAGRWALYTALSLSVAAAAFIAQASPQNASRRALKLFYELVLDRSITLGLAVVIVILMLFLSRYPLHLDRNTYVASGFFSAMFLAQACVKLLDSMSAHLFTRNADDLEVAFASLCFVLWGVLLRAAARNAPTRQPLGSHREAELLQQLESLNDILGRAGKR